MKKLICFLAVLAFAAPVRAEPIPENWLDTCWDPAHCPGQPYGDATCDGRINVFDLGVLKGNWLRSYTNPGGPDCTPPLTCYNCCANFNQDAAGTNVFDLNMLKGNWLSAAWVGQSDGTQTCPDPE